MLRDLLHMKKCKYSPVEQLNTAIATYSRSNRTHRWKGYFEPLVELSNDLPAPILGIMILIWQLRPNDLQRYFPLDTYESRYDFLVWCITHGRSEYQALRDAKLLWDILEGPAFSQDKYSLDDPAAGISRLMLCIHRSRPDVGADLNTESGRTKFLLWYLQHGITELKLNDLPVPEWQREYLYAPSRNSELTRLQNLVYSSRQDLQNAFPLPSHSSQLLRWFAENNAINELAPHRFPTFAKRSMQEGVNVIGHAYGELGIGEDCRMAARSLARANIPVTIIDFDPGPHVSQGDRSCEVFVGNAPLYSVNLICLPAPEHARCFAVMGTKLFEGRHNIGYWPWELAKWPTAWKHMFALADEVWTSTKFAHDSVMSADGEKPLVKLMPMAVELPEPAQLHRGDFGLPAKAILFLFIFDLNSSTHRKNPKACIAAFERAFRENRSQDRSKVGLVIKVHKPAVKNKEWDELKELAKRDNRIHLIERTLSKTELLSLYKVCDVFLSLHRSEGFGRCIAEAMLLEKPVITTAYSGNVDFTNKKNAMPVGFDLEPVLAGQYTAGEDQVWANADIDAAARHMRNLEKSAELRGTIGLEALNTIRNKYSFDAVASAYHKNLINIFDKYMPKKALSTSAVSFNPTKIVAKLGHAQNYELLITESNETKKCTMQKTALDIKKIWEIGESELQTLQSCTYFELNATRRSLAEVLWLAYHVAPHGAKITNKDGFVDSYFDPTGYYYGKLKRVNRTTVIVTSAYKLEDFEGISFCIPTGGDTPELRKCVERILELPIQKEIVLCGKIASTFPYLDKVRVVGEDIPFPPVWITRKKNVAVEEARYSLVAVLHDRVLLPSNFADMLSSPIPVPVMGIGGLFSLSNNFNFIGRYSDFNVLNDNSGQPKFSYLSELTPGVAGEFSLDSSLMMARGAAFFYYTNEEHQSHKKYATGSFYLTSKYVHSKHPLNENLFWEDFEDVEWGLRCERQGIPHVFNSDYYQMTLAVRAMILPPHYYLSNDGNPYVLPPPWMEELRDGKNLPDAVQLMSVERLSSNFIRFINQRNLDDGIVLLFEKAHADSDYETLVELVVDAIRQATQGVKAYDEILIKSVESLMSATLERTNLGDMRCHAEYFNNGFDLWDRISTNYGFVRWLAYLKTPGMLSFSANQVTKEDHEVSDADIFDSCVKNLGYLNKIFGHNESPRYWFDVIKNLDWKR
jgi:glycosyltransferase involved in cell wall biosynthesis